MFRWWCCGAWARYRVFLALGALAVVVRVGILADPLWYDEAFSYALARLPLPNLVGAVVGDVHPPLWYLILWVVYHLGGTTEPWLRLPSLALGLVNLVGVFLIGRRLLGHRAALGALAVAVVSPVMVYYSQEARMYQLLLFGLLLALGGGLARRWGLLVVGSMIALYSHNLAIPSLGVVGLAVVVWHGRRVVWPLYLAALAVGLLWAPGLLLLLYQMGNVAEGFWITPLTLGGFLEGLDFIVFYQLPPWLAIHGVGLALGLVVVVLVLAGRGALRSVGQARRGVLVGMILLAGPPLALAIPSLVWRSVYLPRALILSVVGLALLLGHVWGRVGRNTKRAALAVLVPFVALALGTQAAPGMGRKRNDLRALARQIEAQVGPYDGVYHLSLASYITMAPYFETIPVWVLPEAGDLAQSLSDETKRAMMIPERDPCGAPWDRLWLIDFRTPYTSKREAEAGDLLRATYPVLHTIPVVNDRVVSAGVYLLGRGDGAKSTRITTPPAPPTGKG